LAVIDDPPPTLAEAALVARARAGDGAAITALYLRYAPMIYRYAYQRTGERTLAEDIQSEVFARMLEALPGYEERGRPFAAWLFRIAHARVIDSYRRQARYPATVSSDSLATPGPEALVEAADARAALHQALAQLTPLQRRVVWLHYHEHVPLSHIAVDLASSPDSVRAVHLRALRRMARVLAPMV
jgi:RNA polymerase sigma-70 factor (ECF subfamily)